MAGSNELLTLAQVSSEIDESEVKITFANQCIKAQETLANKLKEEIQRRKEICNFKKGESLKLEAEIRNAELNLQNLRIAHQSILSTNTEMKKDLFLTKDKKQELTDRIKRGEKKYEDLWIKCKAKYECIPLVKTLMQGKKRHEVFQNDINILENEEQSLVKAIKIKKDVLAEKDKKLVIQVAEFISNEMPATLKIINEKAVAVNQLTKDIETITKEQEDFIKAKVMTIDKNYKTSEAESKAFDDEWTLNNTLKMPRLQLPSSDTDVINVKLDINKVTIHASPTKRTVSIAELEKNTVKRSTAEDNYISCYFNKTSENDNKTEKVTDNYSQRKLINILENIQIDDDETYKLVAKANIDTFHEVEVIAADNKANSKELVHEVTKSESYNLQEALDTDDIEEIDLTSTNTQDIVVPPTQFLDLTQLNTNEEQEFGVIFHTKVEEPPQKLSLSQSKDCNTKKVSFDLPMSIQDISDDIIEDDKKTEENPNDTITSQLNMSDDNYMAIKDMILKKHQLDLSPQFVYAKNYMLHKKTEDQIITSKFFESSTNKCSTAETHKSQENVHRDITHIQEQLKCSELDIKSETEKPTEDGNLIPMDVDDAVSSPKAKDTDKPVSGMLFTHGPQGIPDCLDMSMSTTGYDDGDPDFPNCLDSSLLLSPKADLPMPMSGNNSEVTSQDVPNFLSGFRKTGLSFFKQKSTETNADGSQENQDNNFNFNFGADEKKSRGGLFSFFH